MQGITAALFGDDIDKKAFEDRETLRAFIIKRIFSDVSGAVLDISSAVLITIKRPDSPVIYQIVTGEEYDKIVELRNDAVVREKYQAEIEVIDGRWYTKAGKLRAAERKRREEVVVEAMTEIAQDLDAEFGTPEQ